MHFKFKDIIKISQYDGFENAKLHVSRQVYFIKHCTPLWKNFVKITKKRHRLMAFTKLCNIQRKSSALLYLEDIYIQYFFCKSRLILVFQEPTLNPTTSNLNTKDFKSK